ncbi:UvrD-helicase domain-containing protein [Clostridioides difficile]|uniref:DNA helicase, UvrD/REP type n=4 Tax=Clostridioides difficile TaxID=1496 RepID=A0AAX3H871_CLODI|nr:UvrD-helicase domain-containing protein [Clostridioides difficile]AVD35512.1 DNA helicase [Clostridioides difficile]AVD41045.1 DNA helicase [Clostridioides difficile]AVD44550.1 DNA helicase [Clostridioides difficile]AXU67662.1 Superfamily I DNA and RNA helicase [Clostridioides difficile]AXU89832.1 superfamily I DNA/RNA helicase [Clostridioides difficile]
MSQYININSQLDALKLKEFEKIFYENINKDVKVVPKVTPFKGINTDLLYVKDGKILFIKFMDTTEDIFFILEEELLEVMNEEYELLKLKMGQKNRNISYNYVYIMPYVEVEETYEFEEFVNNNIIDKNKLQDIMNKGSLDEYLNDENDEINLNLFLLDVCSEYYIINDKLHLNEKFKKISFYNDDYKYTATMMEEVQIKDVISIKYGNTLIEGGSGIGKTAIMLSRAIKLAKVYPHHKLIIFTHTKQLRNELRERIELLYKDNNNLEVHTFSSFIFKLAKKFNLIVDYNMLKNDYEKAFNNLVKQAQNIIKNKNMFKAIFIDEAESFLEYEIDFIREFLYKTKFIFNVCSCNSLNISNRLNIFKKLYNGIEFDDKIILSKNYRQAKEIVDFTNKFSNNSNSYINELRPNTEFSTFFYTKALRGGNKSVDIIKVSDLDDQISSVIWEIEYLISKKGLDYSEVAIVYPYNKKKLKSGKTIYFQYMLKKALEEAKIPYICAEDNLTNISKKVGTTIANIYAIKNLEYKAVIVCELEMLYNQTINDIEQDYQVNDFVGDLNKVYLAMSRATDYLSIVTTFNEEASDIIRLITESKDI